MASVIPRASVEERAVEFVLGHGNALACARAEALTGRAPAQRVLEMIRDDMLGVLPLVRVRGLLSLCDDLRLLTDARVEGACAELTDAQASDGSWILESPDAEPLYDTGMLAGYLAKTRFARPETLHAAGDFLAAHWTPDLVQEFKWKNIAAYAHCFANLDHEASDAILQWCGRELERGFRTRAFNAVRTARILVYCDAHALPGARVGTEELVVGLVTEQRDDGSWEASPDSCDERRVEPTLDALVALRRLAGAAARAL
jgi:hypothetical protein